MLTCVQAKAIRADFSDEPLASYVKRYSPPFFCSYKLDGDSVFFDFADEAVHMLNRGHTEYHKILPDLALAIRAKIKARKGLLLGELIADDGKQGTLYRIRQYMANGKQDKLSVKFYDCLEADDIDFRSTGFQRRFIELKRIVDENLILEQKTLSTIRKIELFKDSAIKDGYEGVVVKSGSSPYSNGCLLRLKNKETCDCAILGVTKTNGFRETGIAHSLLIGFFCPETQSFKRFGKVGAWENGNFQDWQALTEYLMATSVGEDSEFIHVRPTLCLEISFEAKLQDSFRSGKIMRIRTDKTVEECVA